MFIQQFLFITAYFFSVLLPDPNFDVLILMHVAGTKSIFLFICCPLYHLMQLSRYCTFYITISTFFAHINLRYY